MADRVVPNSLNYTDIKPESIESEIKLVKFQPTSTITGARGGDMIKFMISGNGFLDPYSTYLQFTVDCKDLAAGEVRWLDRSAHSFIQRIIIRSQGVELERIENYDVIASLINDMIYSPEQNSTHHWEGFPTHQYASQAQVGTNGHPLNASNFAADGNACARPQVPGFQTLPNIPERKAVAQFLNQGANPTIHRYIGEAAWSLGDLNIQNFEDAPGGGGTFLCPLDTYHINDRTWTDELVAGPVPLNRLNGTLFSDNLDRNYFPLDFSHHTNGRRIPGVEPLAANSARFKRTGTQSIQFIIPIYSGIIGLLMPDKKLLPLNLLPLDIEIVFNPHALYSSQTAGSRNYTISEFNMYSHMIFFEQDIHKTLEASCADHGIFIYANSFHSAPMTLISGKDLPAVSYISMNLKSINSVHTAFMYNHFETQTTARKQHFVSHNITSLQLLNGTMLIPQYAIEGNAGTSDKFQHIPYIVQLMKAWNKMHDPKTDGAIQAYNFCGDQYDGQMDAIAMDQLSWGERLSVFDMMNKILNKQGLVGRCQYGISLEGEELGVEKSMITGRKSQYPFLLQIRSNGKSSAHTSYMMNFLRADFIVYIRPDLQIVTLGK